MIKRELGTSSRADYATVLINHISMVQARLDNIQPHVTDAGRIADFFKSKNGKELTNIIMQSQAARSADAKLPKISKEIQADVSPLIEFITSTLKTIDYIASWGRTAKNLLANINKNCTDLDIRFNHQLVIHVTKLFTTFSKVAIFLHLSPLCQRIVQMIPLFPELSKIQLTQTYDELYRFVCQSTRNPFSYAKSQLSSMGEKLSLLCAQISPFLIQIFGHWPVIEWEKFSLFEKTVEQLESTLPPTVNIVLQNLTLFRDTVLFFSLIFPEYPSNTPQYSTLMNNVLTESAEIFITPLLKLPIQRLLSIFVKITKNKVFEELTESNEYERSLKDEISHKQRMTNCYYLLRDINDVASFDPDYLPKLINEIIPLAAIGAYEVTTMLANGTIIDQVPGLVDILVDLGMLFIKYEDSLKRFFLYNLTTIDATYLNSLHGSISRLTDDWQIKISNLIKELVDALSIIDIEEFDRGTRYDLTPLLNTANRLFYLFNEVSTKHQAAYLHQIFEHLSTIIMHAEIAQNPKKFFIEFCPIHKLWCFTDLISEYITDLPGGIHTNSAFITLFQFFNLDEIELVFNQPMIKKASNTIIDIRTKLIEKIESVFTSFFKEGSFLSDIINQGSNLHIFDPSKYMVSYTEYELEKVNNLIKYRAPCFQIKEFIRRTPYSVNLFGNEIKLLSFISETITMQLAELMFENKLPSTSWLCSAFSTSPELLWPIYLQMNSSFPYMLIKSKANHSAYQGQESYLDQISIIRSNPDAKSDDHSYKLIGKLEAKVREFLDKYYRNYIFNLYGERFEPITENSSPEFDTLLSYQGFKEVIMDLGPQAGFCLNKIIVSSISESMVKIFNTHQAINNQLSDWWNKFRQKDDSWIPSAVNVPEIKKAGEEMIKLGAALRLRAFIRKALHDVISKSAPGLIELINCSFIKDKGEHISEKQDFLAEMVSGLPSFHFIIIAVNKSGILKTSDCQLFYFFLALLLLNPDWNNIKFIQDLEGFTFNLHLLPTALDAFLATNNSFVMSSDTKKVDEGLATFFDALSHVINYKKSAQGTSKLLSETLVILADIFPKYISRLQYGTVAKSFPTNVVSDAYQKYEYSINQTLQKKPKKKK